jgi:hypothetical protein
LPIVSTPGAASTPLSGNTVLPITLVARLRRLLKDEPWEDTVSVAIGASDTTVQFTNPTKWAPNCIAEIGTEELHISPQATPLANPITVRRAYHATTATAHAVGDVVLKDARIEYHVASEAITAVATRDLEPYIYTAGLITITPSTTTDLYEVSDTNFRGIIGATQLSTGSVTDSNRYPAVKVERNVPSSISASGIALRFPWTFDSTNDINVTYAAAITADTIPEGEVADLIVLGAAARVLKSLAFELTNRDTTARNQKAQVSELVGEANDLRQEFYNKRAKIGAILRAQDPMQVEWEGLDSWAMW